MVKSIDADLPVDIFDVQTNVPLIHQVVTAQLAAARQGTHDVKSRGEVRGGGKKPYRQKHTGRARAGDVKSPIWRGGGTVFGPRPRDYSYHMPAKARRVALRSALAGKIADGELVIADFGSFTAPSSKSARKVLADLDRPRRALLILAEPNENLWKSFRNFPGVEVRSATDVCAYDVVAGGLILAEQAAMDALATRVGVQPEGAGA